MKDFSPTDLTLGRSKCNDLEADECARSLDQARPETEEAAETALNANYTSSNSVQIDENTRRSNLTVLMEWARVVPVAEADGIALRSSTSVDDDTEDDDPDDRYHYKSIQHTAQYLSRPRRTLDAGEPELALSVNPL